MNHLTRGIVLLCMVPLLFLQGCGTATVQHPGAVNTFDSQAYDALLTTQAGIESAKTQFGANPAAKAPLNALIAAYDALQSTYKAYHTAASAGTATAAQQASVQSQIDAVKGQLSQVMTTFGGK